MLNQYQMMGLILILAAVGVLAGYLILGGWRKIGRLLAATGIFLSIAMVILLGIVVVGLAPPLFPVVVVGGVLLVYLLLDTRARLRRARGQFVLAYLEQAARLHLPLAPMLAAAAGTESGRLQECLDGVRWQIESGRPLAVGLEIAVPEVPAQALGLIRIGERMGRLREVLGRLVAEARLAVPRGPRLYPRDWWVYLLLVIFIASMLVLAVMVFIVPKFERIFEDFDTALPAQTVDVIRVAEWIGGGQPGQVIPGAFWIVLVFGGIALLKLLARVSTSGRVLLDQVEWHLPVTHALARDQGLAEVCQVAALVTGAGLPLHRALEETLDLRISDVLRHRVEMWSLYLYKGLLPHDAARSAGLPPLVCGMLAASAGPEQMPRALRFLHRYYQYRHARLSSTLSQALPPIVLLVVAAGVGWIVIGLFKPLVELIWQLARDSGTY